MVPTGEYRLFGVPDARITFKVPEGVGFVLAGRCRYVRVVATDQASLQGMFTTFWRSDRLVKLEVEKLEDIDSEVAAIPYPPKTVLSYRVTDPTPGVVAYYCIRSVLPATVSLQVEIAMSEEGPWMTTHTNKDISLNRTWSRVFPTRHVQCPFGTQPFEKKFHARFYVEHCEEGQEELCRCAILGQRQNAIRASVYVFSMIHNKQTEVVVECLLAPPPGPVNLPRPLKLVGTLSVYERLGKRFHANFNERSGVDLRKWVVERVLSWLWRARFATKRYQVPGADRVAPNPPRQRFSHIHWEGSADPLHSFPLVSFLLNAWWLLSPKCISRYSSHLAVSVQAANRQAKLICDILSKKRTPIFLDVIEEEVAATPREAASVEEKEEEEGEEEEEVEGQQGTPANLLSIEVFKSWGWGVLMEFAPATEAGVVALLKTILMHVFGAYALIYVSPSRELLSFLPYLKRPTEAGQTQQCHICSTDLVLYGWSRGMSCFEEIVEHTLGWLH